MKKWETRLLSTILSIAFVCTGCTPGTGQSESPSRSDSSPKQVVSTRPTTDSNGLYHFEVEEIWNRNLFGGGFTPLIRRGSDGQTLMLLDSEEQYSICRLEDGKEPEKIVTLPDKMDQWTPTEDGTGRPYIRSFDVDDEGNIYVLYRYRQLYHCTLDAYDKEGNLTTADIRLELQPKAWKSEQDPISKVHVYGGMIYILTGFGDLQVVTLEGDPVALPFEADYMRYDSLDFDENGLLYLSTSVRGSPGSYEVLKINPENNFEILARQKIPDGTGEFASYSGECGKLFLMNKDKIISCGFDENGYQTEINFGEDISLTLGEKIQNGLPVMGSFLADGEDLLLSVVQQGEAEFYNFFIYRLKKEPGPPKEQKYEKTITITASYRQDFLEDAVRIYQAKHPEIGVEWDIFYNSRNDFLPHSDDAGQKLLTKIMANDVGDIVATAGMGFSYKNALQTDAFIDLTDRITTSQYYSKLNPNTLKAITLDGTVRGLPVGAVYPIMRYTNTLEPGLKVDSNITWSDVLQIGLDHPERPLFGMVTMNREYTILSDMFEANVYDMIDFEAKAANLHEPWFMELMEKLKAVYQQGNLATEIPLNINFWPDYSNLNFFFELLTLQGLYGNYSSEYKDADGGVTVMPLPHGEKNSNRFAYGFRMYSISSNSQQQDAAWDLLDFLLSYEAQTLPSLDSTPINIEAEQKMRQSFPEALSNQFDVVENEIDYLYDTSSYRIQAVPILFQYLTGAKTLEDALKEAEYEIWLILNE